MGEIKHVQAELAARGVVKTEQELIAWGVTGNETSEEIDLLAKEYKDFLAY